MRNDESSFDKDSLHEAHMPKEVIVELLNNQVRHTIAPYSIEVNTRHIKDWCDDNALLEFHTYNLIREIKNWGNHLRRRPINRINIVEPFTLLDASELTELTHAIAQNLKLQRSSQTEHIATLTEDEVTRKHIALLKGLHFNHIRISVGPFNQLEKILCCRDLVDTFKFGRFSVALEHEVTRQELWQEIVDYVSYVKPDMILVPHLKSVFGQNDDLGAQLAQFGYGLSAPAAIVKLRSVHLHATQDCLRLGPGAHSQFGPLRTVNFRHPTTYLNMINSTSLPVALCR